MPKGYHSIGEVMTNFDHSINEDKMAELKTGKYIAIYTAWNFFGYVWWDTDKQLWCCEIWHSHSPIDFIVAKALLDIMVTASQKYGHS